ncbi:MAG TPA: hypothetical protein VK348_08870, partial [Planctomycetota bacterium]|nr:hypothetical protein [Planctomycetota bacterium]
WQDSDPADQRRWTLPDLPVATTFADWMAGRDPVLDAAIAHHPTEMAGYTTSPPIHHWLRASQTVEWQPALLGSRH